MNSWVRKKNKKLSLFSETNFIGKHVVNAIVIKYIEKILKLDNILG